MTVVIALLSLLTTALANVASICQASPSGSFKVDAPAFSSQPKSAVDLTWRHDCAANTTSFLLSGESAGWLGVGFVPVAQFNNSAFMTRGDFYQFAVYPNGTMTVKNGYGTHNGRPSLSTPAAFVGTPVVQLQGTMLSASWTLAWTPQANSTQAPLNDGALRVMFARSAQPSVNSYHSQDRFLAEANLDLFPVNDSPCKKYNTGGIVIQKPFDNSTKMPATDVLLSWKHDCLYESTKFTLTGDTYGWLGVGFVETSKLQMEYMRGADLNQFLINATTGNAIAYNSHGIGNTRPVANSPQEYMYESITLNGTKLTAVWERFWDARNSEQVPLNQGSLRVLVARALSRDIKNYHYTQRSLWANELHLFGPPATHVATTTNLITTKPSSTALPTTTTSAGSHCTPGVHTYSISKPWATPTKMPVTNVTLHWQHDCAKKTTQFTLQGDTFGWLGVGMVQASKLNNQYMKGADISQFSFNGTAHYKNRHGIANTEPVDNKKQEFVGAVSVNYTGTFLTAQWTRAWSAADAEQVPLDQGPLRFIFARADESDLRHYHQSQAFLADATVDLFSNGPTPPPTSPPTTTTKEATTVGPDGDPCANNVQFSNKLDMKFESDPVTVNYTINCEKKLMTLTVTGRSLGWLAVGWNDQPRMKGGDVYMLMIKNDGNAVAKNYFAVGHHIEETPDQSIIVGKASGVRTGDLLSMTFTRRLEAQNDKQFTLSHSRPLHLMLARRDIASFEEPHLHTPAGRAVTQKAIQFFSGAPLPPPENSDKTYFLLIHGGLMLLAWTVLAPAGAFFARFLKDLGRPWYLWHRGLFMTVTLFTAVAFVFSIVYANISGSGNFNLMDGNPHKIIGLIFVILSFLQPCLGILANRMYVVNRFETPVFPDRVHWWLGRTLLLTGFVNSYLGLRLFPGPTATQLMPVPVVLFLVWCFVAVAIQVLGAAFVGAVHHNHSETLQFVSDTTPLVSIAQKSEMRAKRWFYIIVGFLILGLIICAVTVLKLKYF